MHRPMMKPMDPLPGTVPTLPGRPRTGPVPWTWRRRRAAAAGRAWCSCCWKPRRIPTWEPSEPWNVGGWAPWKGKVLDGLMLVEVLDES